MGILRSDRVSGLGGANAINGSVFFGGDQHLRVATSSEFDLSNSNFTLECWINFSGFDGTGFDTILMATLDGTGANSTFQFDYKNSTNNLRFIPYVSNSSVVYESSWTPVRGTWYHIAACRSGADLKIFVDGTQIGSTHNIGSQTVDGDDVPIGIGQRRGNLDRGVIGHISNLRLVVGTALYTSNFTAPDQRLTNIDNTVLLCCQSPGNALKEETGKTIESVLDNVNNAPPMASHFAPDKGEDHGTTFTDNTKFDTLSYMVPPGGTTAESNRGRAVFGGGESPSADSVMEYMNIQSGGRTVKFGDTSITTPGGTAVSSSTRGVFTLFNSPANQNCLEYITIATTSNATDFGDQTVGIEQEGSASNATRGLFAGGLFPGSTAYNKIEYITIATIGNAIDFGDLGNSITSLEGTADATRAVFAGGIGPGSPWPVLNTIEYVTIATTSNTTDFGDLTVGARSVGSTGDSTRGVWMGGSTPSNTNFIDYVTIQTTGNASDFGDLVTASQNLAATSNSIRGIMGAGMSPSRTNTIEQITIQSTGNASDFGDLTRLVSQIGACSDSHGGIS